MNRTLALALALAIPASATAQAEQSPWRFGVSLAAGTVVGVTAEYWNDDLGVEARLGTLFPRPSFRLTPKYRVGQWDGGEASLRAGVEIYGGGTTRFFHGGEIAAITDAGHAWGGAYNLPLGGFTDIEALDEIDPPPPGAVALALNLVFGELFYRYQP